VRDRELYEGVDKSGRINAVLVGEELGI